VLGSGQGAPPLIAEPHDVASAMVKRKRSSKGYARRKRPRTGRSKKKLVKLIKSVSLRNTETKENVVHAFENTNLGHNGGAIVNYNQMSNLLSTSQGTAQNNRVGDEIFAKGIKIKLWLSNKKDRPNVIYRIFVCSAPKDTYNQAAPTGLFKGDIGNKLLDMFDTDRYKVVYHKIIKVGSDQTAVTADGTVGGGTSSIAGKECSRLHSFYIPLRNRRIKYESDGGSVPMGSNNLLFCGVIAYDAFGTLTTDNIASFAGYATLYFKDP